MFAVVRLGRCINWCKRRVTAAMATLINMSMGSSSALALLLLLGLLHCCCTVTLRSDRFTGLRLGDKHLAVGT